MNDQVPQWLTYDFPPAVKAKVNRLWGGGEWHGQAQKWSVVFFSLPFYLYNSFWFSELTYCAIELLKWYVFSVSVYCFMMKMVDA